MSKRKKPEVRGHGGARPGAGRKLGGGQTDPRIMVSHELLKDVARLACFSGMSAPQMANVVLREWANDRLATIGGAAIERFERLESARVLKGMGPAHRRAHFARALEFSGLDLDVFQAGWDEAVAMADSMTSDDIEAEIVSLRAEASRRLRAGMAAHGNRPLVAPAETAGHASH
jgi:hypothetical protein